MIFFHQLFGKLISFAKVHKIVSLILLMVILTGGYYWYTKAAGTATVVRYLTAQVEKGTLVASVSGTGQVEASDQIDLKPQTDGRLTKVSAKENQEVKTGDIIAVIDQQSAANSVAQARASLEQAQANYQKLTDGATSNEIQSQQLSVASAQQALDQTKQDYDNTVIDQQQTVSQAQTTLLNNGLAAEASNTNSSATITLSGNYTGTEQGSYTITLYESGSGISYNSSGLGSGSGLITRGIAQPIGNGLYLTFSATGSLDTSTVWKINVPNQKSSSYISNLNAYNNALQNQKEALQKAQNAIDSAQNALDRARLSLASTIEPPTSADIASAKAQITSAQAQLSNAQTVYDNTILRAPFDGVVASVDYSTGDKITAGTTVATLITKQQVAKITLNEVDAAKVKVGQLATLTFSALPEATLTGKVADVDNIGTVSQNVVNFTVKILLDTQDNRIKPGMSVSATIITESRPDVLTVPSAAVKTGNGQNYVEVMVNGKPEQRTVTAGLSNDTSTEISGNISEGDEVVTQTVTGSAAKTSGTSGNLLQSLTGGNRIRTSTGGGNSSSGSKTTSGSSSAPAGSPPGGM